MKGRFSVSALFDILGNRVLGACIVIGVFVGGYFLSDGKFFTAFLMLWMFLAMGELEMSKFCGQYEPRDTVPEFAHLATAAQWLLFIAIVLCFTIEQFSYKLSALAVYACWISDTSGLLMGSIFGKNRKVKRLAKISKNKSYPGFAGAILLPIPFIILLAFVMGITDYFSLTRIYIFAAFSGLVATLGDLFGSAAKRGLGIKDSAQDFVTIPVIGLLAKPLLKGHGGYYDRSDSICFQIIFAFICFADFASH